MGAFKKGTVALACTWLPHFRDLRKLIWQKRHSYLYRRDLRRCDLGSQCAWFPGLMLVPVTNPLTADGGSSFSSQLIGAATIFGWVLVTSLIVWGILKAVIGIRVSEQEEYEGTGMSECGTEACPEFVGTAGSGRLYNPCGRV
jgi:hypothetical protein